MKIHWGELASVVVAFALIVALGYLFATAFVAETEMRLERLQQHRQAQIERAQ